MFWSHRGATRGIMDYITKTTEAQEAALQCDSGMKCNRYSGLNLDSLPGFMTWAGYLTFLNLSFLIYKYGIVMPALKIYSEG